jgi:hypothetical protein
MLICPALRIALITQFLIEKSPVIHSRKTTTIASGVFDLPSGLKLQLVPSIEQLDRSVWEEVTSPEKLFLQWDFLQAFEKNAPANMTFHYALVSDKKKAQAAFYFQVIHLSAEEITYIVQPLTDGVKTKGFGSQISEWLQKSREQKGFRLLISGNNFISGEYGVAMKQDADPEKMYIALAETVKMITENDRDPGKISAILVKDYFEKDVKQTADHIRKKRYHRFMVEPEMIVTISPVWKKFEDYLGAMSKKYRNRAKSVLKKTEKINVRELTAKELQVAGTEIFNLYRNVHEKAKFRLSILSENYFTEMKRKFPETFHVYAYELNGKTVAFRSSFHLQSHLEAHFIGIDYSENENCPLYQRILYDYILEGINAGNTKVFLGRTASEMKSTVGAVAHDLVCYIRHRNGFSNQIIRPFIDYLKPSSWVPRNPFKEE